MSQTSGRIAGRASRRNEARGPSAARIRASRARRPASPPTVEASEFSTRQTDRDPRRGAPGTTDCPSCRSPEGTGGPPASTARKRRPSWCADVGCEPCGKTIGAGLERKDTRRLVVNPAALKRRLCAGSAISLDSACASAPIARGSTRSPVTSCSISSECRTRASTRTAASGSGLRAACTLAIRRDRRRRSRGMAARRCPPSGRRRQTAACACAPRHSMRARRCRDGARLLLELAQHGPALDVRESPVPAGRNLRASASSKSSKPFCRRPGPPRGYWTGRCGSPPSPSASFEGGAGNRRMSIPW